MKKYLFLLFSCLLSLSAYSQQDTLITGRVLDRSGQPIYEAAVMAYRLGKKRGLKMTDKEGKFTIKMGNPQDSVMIDFIGYEPVVMRYSDFFIGQLNDIVLDDWGPLHCEEVYRCKTEMDRKKQEMLVDDVPIEELRSLIWEFPQSSDVFYKNQPSTHVARTANEFVDFLFWENPLRNDYEQFGVEMLNRFRKEALCNERGEDIIRFVKAMDAQGGKWKAEAYWKKILESYLPNKVFRLYRMRMYSLKSPKNKAKLNVVNMCYQRIYLQYYIPSARKEIDKSQKVYFKKLGISTKGVKFSSSKSYHASQFSGYGK